MSSLRYSTELKFQFQFLLRVKVPIPLPISLCFGSDMNRPTASSLYRSSVLNRPLLISHVLQQWMNRTPPTLPNQSSFNPLNHLYERVIGHRLPTCIRFWSAEMSLYRFMHNKWNRNDLKITYFLPDLLWLPDALSVPLQRREMGDSVSMA